MDIACTEGQTTRERAFIAMYRMSLPPSCRSLRCVRNTIHTNLFVALMCNSVVWIVWYHGVVYRMSDWEVGWLVPPHIAGCLIWSEAWVSLASFLDIPPQRLSSLSAKFPIC